jgi:Domain of unknown function (DUF6602)
MLAEYDLALVHAKEQVVSTHHGVVGEAAVRNWLQTFLPKRYGIVSGYIRSQGVPKPHQTRHFDVIIYDQLESPTLWTEENKDKSDAGRARIIPAEFVRAVLEVKAAFNKSTVADALAKLAELDPLMAGFDPAGERYPRYLPSSAVLGMVFFELRASDQDDIEALNLFRAVAFERGFYGAVILRGPRKNPDDTALIERAESNIPMEEMRAPNGLGHGVTRTATTEVLGNHLLALMMWSDINFSRFAFDLLALLQGTYRRGFVSSFHGLDFSGAEGSW